MTTLENLTEQANNLILASLLLGTPGEETFQKHAPGILIAQLSGDNDAIGEQLVDFLRSLAEYASDHNSDMGDLARAKSLKLLDGVYTNLSSKDVPASEPVASQSVMDELNEQFETLAKAYFFLPSRIKGNSLGVLRLSDAKRCMLLNLENEFLVIIKELYERVQVMYRTQDWKGDELCEKSVSHGLVKFETLNRSFEARRRGASKRHMLFG